MQVAKWGDSPAIRLPAAVVEALRLERGDESEIHAAGERAFAVAHEPGEADFPRRLRACRGRMPKDFTLDREAANAR